MVCLRAGGDSTLASLVMPRLRMFGRQDYESKFYFWEIVELLRKVAFTSVVVFFAGTPVQMILSVVLALGSVIAYGYFQPFRTQSDDDVMTLSNVQLFFALFYGLLDLADMTQA